MIYRNAVIACLLGLLFISTDTQAQKRIETLEQAFASSQSSNRTVMIIFSGSDWCKPCIRLKEDILSTENFKDYADDHVVPVILDFPYRKKNKLNEDKQAYNEQLAEKYNEEGVFPKIILFGEDRSIKAQLSYQIGMTSGQFISQLKDQIGPS